MPTKRPRGGTRSIPGAAPLHIGLKSAAGLRRELLRTASRQQVEQTVQVLGFAPVTGHLLRQDEHDGHWLKLRRHLTTALYGKACDMASTAGPVLGDPLREIAAQLLQGVGRGGSFTQ
ncbi:hypothetical protein [Streptomyces sp. NPDC058657]|uniref:hypothetical protein n=1 Tax=unclassified Streptomyces TaxID=2593676 RepID=UPI003650903E